MMCSLIFWSWKLYVFKDFRLRRRNSASGFGSDDEGGLLAPLDDLVNPALLYDEKGLTCPPDEGFSRATGGFQHFSSWTFQALPLT